MLLIHSKNNYKNNKKRVLIDKSNLTTNPHFIGYYIILIKYTIFN